MVDTEALLHPLFDEIADGVCVADAAGRILYLNRAAQDMLGITAQELARVSLCDLLCAHLWEPGQAGCAAAHCPLRGDGEASSRGITFRGRYGPRLAYEWKGLSVQKQERWRQLRVRCLRMPLVWGEAPQSDKHFVIIEDVSAEFEFEKAKEDWRNMVAHDLRTPLTTVFVCLRELEESLAQAPRPEAEDRLINMGVRNCRRMTELLDLYLDLAKLDAGLMPVKAEALGLKELVSASVNEQLLLAQEKGIAVAQDVPPELRVSSDPELLPRVVGNLVNNAIKYTQEGGRVEIKASLPDVDWAHLTVKDNGPGIDPQDMPHLFERFFRAKTKPGRSKGGSGLGLAFCSLALKAMRGGISVDSEPGKGSAFTVRLPTSRAEEAKP